MIPQALGFFGWKRPQVAAKTLRGLARCPGIERWPLIAFLDACVSPNVVPPDRAALISASASTTLGVLTSNPCTERPMPILSVFFGIIVRMWHDDHPPPHIHVEYQGFEALVDVRTGEVRQGRLPGRAATIVKE